MLGRMTVAFFGVVVLAATGCGGGGPRLDTPEAVAKKVGCIATFKPDTTEELFAEGLGKCYVEGQEVSLYTFATNAARDQWVSFATEFGGRFVQGDGWVAVVPDPETQKKVTAAVDGGTPVKAEMPVENPDTPYTYPEGITRAFMESFSGTDAATGRCILAYAQARWSLDEFLIFGKAQNTDPHFDEAIDACR